MAHSQQSTPVYILHPKGLVFQQWLLELEACRESDSDWSKWRFAFIEYDDRANFRVHDMCMRVRNQRGPIVLIEKVQRPALQLLRDSLPYEIIATVDATDSTDVWAGVCDARKRFEDGEPHRPRKYVLAILILKKLLKDHFWGGKDKSYIWSDNIRKGRGVPEHLSPFVAEVVSDLYQHDILIRKTSCGKSKYALNPSRKPEIHKICEECKIPDERLYRLLMKDPHLETTKWFSSGAESALKKQALH